MRKLILGNWKMFGHASHVAAFAQQLTDHPGFYAGGQALQWGFALPSPYIAAAVTQLRRLGVWVGGQTCHSENQGAFTGDVSAAMLADVGADFVIVGHSERRCGHGETNQQVASQAQRACEAGLRVVVCVGEDQEHHHEAASFVRAQLLASLPPMTAAMSDRLIVAYEPIWAIGTGQRPCVAQVEPIAAVIRECCASVGADVRVPVLYGGSVTADVVVDFLASPSIDGVLVGKASQNASDVLAFFSALSVNQEAQGSAVR